LLYPHVPQCGGLEVVETSLARLRELALALPRPGCEWESRPTFDPPATPEAIAAFELAVGFPLPADFRAFLASAGAVIGMCVHNGYWLGGVEQLARLVEVGSLPREVAGELVAPVATDGGGNSFLLCSGGRVLRWGHDTGVVSAVAGSFAAFLERVADDWAAYVAGTPDWRLDLNGTAVTDAGLKELRELKNLQNLNLDNTKITDAGIKELKGLTGLQELEVLGTQVTEAGVTELKARLPGLWIH